MYRDIAEIVYLLDVVVVMVYIAHCHCWIIYYCTGIEVSVLRAGRGWKFLLTEIFFAKKCSWVLNTQTEFKNVPGVLKRTHIFLGGGGVFGAPHARGRKTIYFFL